MPKNLVHTNFVVKSENNKVMPFIIGPLGLENSEQITQRIETAEVLNDYYAFILQKKKPTVLKKCPLLKECPSINQMRHCKECHDHKQNSE